MMRFTQALSVSLMVAGAVLALPLGSARAADAPITMKISVPTIHDIPNEWIDGFAAAIAKGSGGRIKPEVYPASQLGSIPRQIEGTQFGSIQCELIPPEFMVGLDTRFQVLAAPGLINGQDQGARLAGDPDVRQLMLGIGADKGLHGVGLFFAEPDEMVSRTAIRTLADLKGKKVRIFASPFQTTAFQRLGMNPVAMTLGDVLPGLQEGTIDAAITGIGPVVTFKMIDAAKYVLDIQQPAIFIIVETSKKWFDALPKDLQGVIEQAATAEDKAIVPIAAKDVADESAEWKKQGGTLTTFSTADQAALMKTLGDVGTEVAKSNPQLDAAYKTVTDAAKKISTAAK